MEYDVIIRNGTVIDGTGQDSYRSDIAVRDGVICKIGDLSDETADTAIDAEGKLVTPGFIDMHSHGDATLLIYPYMESKIMQGITTIVAGQCGLSPAPLEKYWVAASFESDLLEEIDTNVFQMEYIVETERILNGLQAVYGLTLDWHTFAEYLERVEQQGIAVNFVPLVGHGQVRATVMGRNHRRAATEAEISRMKEYIEEAMQAGAHGVSVGLDYTPGIYADFAELAEMAGTAGKYGGYYSAHWRKTGLRVGTPKKQKKIDGIIETLEIGRQTGARVQLAHLSVGYDIYPANDEYMQKAAAQRTLQVIDDYRNRGVKAAFDVVPNVTAGLMKPELITFFSGWIRASGGIERFIENIRADDYRQNLIDMICTGRFYAINPLINPDWDEFMTVVASKNKKYAGKNVREIGEMKGTASVNVIFELLCEDPDIVIFSSNRDMQKCSAREFLRHPQATVCTDSFAFDLEASWKRKDGKLRFTPGTNAYCAFVKYLTEYGMERIEDTIYKATGKAAEILGLKNRGFLLEGQKADVLVIDYERLRTNENLVDPRIYPSGIEYVLINGGMAVKDAKPTGALAGEVIRKNG